MAKKIFDWVHFTRRTNNPKLRWLELQLDLLGIPHRRHGRSAHAPILEVPKDREEEAWSILNPDIDDLPDNDPLFKKGANLEEVRTAAAQFAQVDVHLDNGKDLKLAKVTRDQLQELGGIWALYQNQTFDHSQFGHIKCLHIGPGWTFQVAPERLPDTATEINWPYQLVGLFDTGRPDSTVAG